MIFDDKQIILKDGRAAILRSSRVEDAEKLLNYIKKSCGETGFLARYPEEWNTTIEQEEAWVNRLRSSPDTLGITCYVDGEVAGNCEISFKGGMKTSHRATIAIAIMRDISERSGKHTWQAGHQGTLIAFLPSMMNHTWQAMHRGAPDTNLRFPCWATSQTL